MDDMIVIGAGPAGCAAATLLARNGLAVTLIEQHRFPRDKVCGECLSALGISVLERLGVGEAIRGLSPALLTHAAVHTPGGTSVRLPLPQAMWGVSRSSFDAMLLEQARARGVTVCQPARCESIEFSPQPTVRVRDLQTNEVARIRAQRIIVADGKGALPTRVPPRTGDFGIKAHFANMEGPRDTIELFGCRGLYGGGAAIERDRWNVAFSVPAERLRRHGGDVAAVFDEICGENSVLRRRMRNATRCGEWVVAPLPRFGVQARWPQGVIPVGNAAAAIEPIGGEGIGLALRSAELVAEALIDEQTVVVPPGSVGRLPHARHSGRKLRGAFDSMWGTRGAACRAWAMVTSRPALARALVPLLHSRMVANAVLRLVGKA